MSKALYLLHPLPPLVQNAMFEHGIILSFEYQIEINVLIFDEDLTIDP